MVLRLTTTHRPATDLGYLLHKNPYRTHVLETSFGRALVVFPEAIEERCTASLMIEVDPVSLVRGKGRGGGRWDQYVNDRPYVASSYLSLAIARLFGTALTGRSKERQELADQEIPLQANIPVVRGGSEEFLKSIFEPLGYIVEARRLPLDEKFPEWGQGPYFDLTLSASKTVKDLLTHLYVLIPVLDDSKHYYVDRDEVEKLIRKGGDWLASHPEKDKI
ncbi:MAG TPA: hypothetical protein VNI20_04830, partial [Fimbriimonadaceae bacterium]|nr:hypothetical protein [Fimbriimonadaceae bacterium]